MKARCSLGFFPTPVHRLARLSRKYHPWELYIKRDDQTGLASGGNKTRKLEFLIQQALDQQCDTIITMGAQQSNHCRQTAAACAAKGLECHLLLRGEEPRQPGGNLLLSHLLGAGLHYCGDQISDEHARELVGKLESTGKRPYVIPYGGSNLTGALGFIEAAGELKQQLTDMNLDIDYIFFASCSGGTQAGLILGKEKYGLPARLMAVSIQKADETPVPLEQLVADLVQQGRGAHASSLAIDLIRGYDDPGYGVVTQNEKQAIHELASMEGILLDPVYTARAFYAMTHHLRRQLIEPGAKVLFWHTGGLPANFYYAPHIL